MRRLAAPIVVVACALAGCSDDHAATGGRPEPTGGLSDVFSGGKTTPGQALKDRIAAAERRVAANRHDAAALADLARARYQLATVESDPSTGSFRPEARSQLEDAVAAWQRYLDATAKPDPTLASVALQAYVGLTKLIDDAGERLPLWQGASEAAEIIASARETPEAYIQLVEYASLAGQTRKADLAGEHAIALAPARQRAAVRQSVKQAKLVAAAQGP
jgi:hypothetical protein